MTINIIKSYSKIYTWQRPNSTEEEVYEKINNIKNNFSFNYIAFPWATYVDKFNSLKTSESFCDFILSSENINFEGNKLNITCFQSYHIYKFIEDFKKMNINIIFSPHCEIEKIYSIFTNYQILILPIFLIPIINLESKDKLIISEYIDTNLIPKHYDLDFFKKNKDFEYNNKKYDLSFIGSTKYNYDSVSSFRKKCILEIEKKENSYIFEVNKWHLNDLIYSVMNKEKEMDKINRELNYYQNMLYSNYIVCPKGIGPNSFRISETIKFNNIPVIISDKLVLPKIDGMKYEDYSITLKEKDVSKLATLNFESYNIDKIKSNIKKVNKYLDNLANPIINFFDERFNLLIVFYKVDKESERYNEYKHVITKNLENNLIKKIYIFFEFLDDFSYEEIITKYDILNNRKIEIIPCKRKYRRSICFNSMIDFANENLFGEKVIISNNDIFFENLNIIKKEDLILKNMILALTRTNCFKMLGGDKGSFWQKHDLSQDSWIFVSPIKKINLTIFIGWQGCDNRFAYELYKNGYNLSNPTNEIVCYHYQKSNNFLDYSKINTHHGDGYVLNVPFTKYNEISLSYNFKFSSHFFRYNKIPNLNLFKVFDFVGNCPKFQSVNIKNIQKVKDLNDLLFNIKNCVEKYLIVTDKILPFKEKVIYINENFSKTDIKNKIIHNYVYSYLNYPFTINFSFAIKLYNIDFFKISESIDSNLRSKVFNILNINNKNNIDDKKNDDKILFLGLNSMDDYNFIKDQNKIFIIWHNLDFIEKKKSLFMNLKDKIITNFYFDDNLLNKLLENDIIPVKLNLE